MDPYKGDKRASTIHVSDSLLRDAKERKINVSAVTTLALKFLLKYQTPYKELLELGLMKAEKERLQKEIQTYEVQISKMRQLIEKISKDIESQQKIVDDIEQGREISRNIRNLNTKIIDCGFDIEKVRKAASEELFALERLGLNITDEWLKRQVQRIEVR